MKQFEVDYASEVNIPVVSNTVFHWIPTAQGKPVVEYHNSELKSKRKKPTLV